MNSKYLTNVSMLGGRIMLAAVFIMAGFSKLGAGYAGTQAYMESAGLPGLLLPAVITLEIMGGIALLAGFQTRVVALILAGFTLLASLIFHSDFSQQMQMILFMKNIGLIGGFMVLAAQGPGDWAFNPAMKLREA
jgi:putative oxidoreductase